MRRKIFIVLAIIWMAVIFYFSARQGEDSSMDSSRVSDLILSIVNPGYRQLPPEEKQKMLETISQPVRKAAHASEYAILAGLFMGALIPARLMTRAAQYKKKALRYACGAWGAAVFYAATDEIHQYFVPERACSFADICIDGTGALAGVLAAAIIMRQYLKRHGS